MVKKILAVIAVIGVLYFLVATGGIEWAWGKSDVIGLCVFAYWAFYRIDKAETEVRNLKGRVATLEYQISRSGQHFESEWGSALDQA